MCFLAGDYWGFHVAYPIQLTLQLGASKYCFVTIFIDINLAVKYCISRTEEFVLLPSFDRRAPKKFSILSWLNLVQSSHRLRNHLKDLECSPELLSIHCDKSSGHEHAFV